MVIQQLNIGALPVSVSANSSTVDVSAWGNKTVILNGNFVGTYAIQISIDGVNFQTYTSQSAAGAFLVQAPCYQLRILCTAFTSGTGTAAVCGIYDERRG